MLNERARKRKIPPVVAKKRRRSRSSRLRSSLGVAAPRAPNTPPIGTAPKAFGVTDQRKKGQNCADCAEFGNSVEQHQGKKHLELVLQLWRHVSVNLPQARPNIGMCQSSVAFGPGGHDRAHAVSDQWIGPRRCGRSYPTTTTSPRSATGRRAACCPRHNIAGFPSQALR